MSGKNLEAVPTPEYQEAKKEFSSRIVLSIFRHSDKEKALPGQADTEVLLTGKGRDIALERSSLFKLPDSSLQQAVAFGSPRKRTQETAALVMGGTETFSGEETLDQLQQKIDQGKKFGSKLSVDHRLDFTLDKSPYGDELMKSFKEGRFIDFLVHESDERATELGDAKSTTYSRQAAKVAEVVKKYIEIAPRFDALVQDKKYEKNMQRFMGTHQSVGEAFLAKVIEKTQGKDARDAFVKEIEPGFGFVEGFKIEIQNVPGKAVPEVAVHFERPAEGVKEGIALSERVPVSLLNEIIDEGGTSTA
jgi:hypothetical protein